MSPIAQLLIRFSIVQGLLPLLLLGPLMAQSPLAQHSSETKTEAIKKLSKGEAQFFESKVRPLLIDRCYGCHSLDSNLAEGGLRLDTREAVLRGGTGGPAIVSGEPDTSMLIRAVEYRDKQLQMPPEGEGGRLSDAEIKILKQWIRMGAPDPREEPEHMLAGDKREEPSDWWAYQPLKKSDPGADPESQWAWNHIDRWVERSLRKAEIAPLVDAEPATLLRRLHFDITGLPPTIEDINAFTDLIQTKSRKEAIEIVVDLLLESEDFSTHWGRHWLDVARYGESSGREVNIPYNHAWRYRDWVIDAFENNMPFDRFLVAQIAGDQLPHANDAERASNLIATGFLAIGSRNLNEGNPLQFAVDQADEQIDTLFQAMMGTTFACARCHDHKFDPITQREYTALAGIFLSTETRFGAVGGNNPRTGAPALILPKDPSVTELPSPWSPEEVVQKREKLSELQKQRDTLEEEVKSQRKQMSEGKPFNRNTQAELRKVSNLIRDLESQLDFVDTEGMPRPLGMGVVDKPPASESDQRQSKQTKTVKKPNNNANGRRPSFASIADSPFFARGEIGMPGERIPRSVPDFCGDSSRFSIPPQSSGRLELAQWMVSPENPLTPRVAANRIWYWMMGQGIVDTVDNFGTTGSEPSHPELLDHLAIQLRDNGWNVKQLIRTIATSRTYQLTSVLPKESPAVDSAITKDPENRLYWRGKRRRLGAEEMRDSLLFVAGKLETSRPLATTMAKHCSTKIDKGLGRKREKGEVISDDVCRSVYLSLPRSQSPEVLELFDLPDGSFVQGIRESTNVPSQSLFLLNSPQVAGHAAAVVKTVTQRIPGRGTQNFDERATLLWQMLLSRPPATEELEWARNLWTGSDAGDAGWISIVRGLIATAEYRYLD
jgi:hypothetical protein